MSYLNLKDFQEEGYLLEVNRQFFHPLGLAIGIYYDENDLENEKGFDPEVDEPKGLVIYDTRDDPEGYAFDSLVSDDDSKKYKNIERLWSEKATVRLERFGWVVQPMGSILE